MFALLHSGERGVERGSRARYLSKGDKGGPIPLWRERTKRASIKWGGNEGQGGLEVARE